MKIALAQINPFIGDFEGNFLKICEGIDKAFALSADLVVFPELSVCGYPTRDFLDYKHFTKASLAIVDRVAAYGKDKLAVIVGSPSFNPAKEGKDLYNTAFLLYQGKIIHTSHKALLPTYDIFDEYRYFEPAHEFSTIDFNGKRLAITVCEDIWNIGNENPLYKVCPMDELIGQQPDIMINLSASPFSYNHAAERIDIAKANAKRYGLPLFYANQVGAQTEVIFDGGSLVVAANGDLIREMPYFEEGVEVFDTDHLMPQKEQPKEKYQLMHDALVIGIKDYFRKLGFTKAIVGLSGGVDSALTVALAVAALGKGNVLSVLMPSQYSSEHSVSDSLELVKNLGSPYKIIPIKEVFDQYDKILQPHFEGLPFNVTEENLQARIRANYLMALSNKFGYILLNTTNKSEAAVGYGTIYGDLCGGIGVLGDVYKTQVYEVCKIVNKDKEIIPHHVTVKPPSAELRPGQKDSDSLPEYPILDPILYEYIENQQGLDEILAKGYDEALVKRVLKLVNRAEYKRYQTPPMLRVSHKAFGMGRRLPIVGKYLE
ncbi:MAG: NAD+ synthase [Chitinophagales bacterium]|nr:NAD+ synthase [Chitinophagales bacterium]